MQVITDFDIVCVFFWSYKLPKSSVALPTQPRRTLITLSFKHCVSFINFLGCEAITESIGNSTGVISQSDGLLSNASSSFNASISYSEVSNATVVEDDEKSQHSDGDTEVNNATLAVTEQPEPSEKHNLTQNIESELQETGNSSSVVDEKHPALVIRLVYLAQFCLDEGDSLSKDDLMREIARVAMAETVINRINSGNFTKVLTTGQYKFGKNYYDVIFDRCLSY